MKGDVTHTGGGLSSYGKVLHKHKHPGDSGGETRDRYDNCKIYLHKPGKRQPANRPQSQMAVSATDGERA